MTQGDLERRVGRLERWNGALVLALLLAGGALGWRGTAAEVDTRVGEVQARFPGG